MPECRVWVMTDAAAPKDKSEHIRDTWASWTYLPKFDRVTSRDAFEVKRLQRIHTFFLSVVRNAYPDFVGLEGYAFSQANRAHQLGEVGGMLRLVCASNHVPFRVHDPCSLKLFATGSGRAGKSDVVVSCQTRLDRPNILTRGVKIERRLVEDVADAFVLALMVRAEDDIKKGKRTLGSLTSGGYDVLSRQTDKNPIAVVDRPWIGGSGHGPCKNIENAQTSEDDDPKNR